MLVPNYLENHSGFQENIKIKACISDSSKVFTKHNETKFLICE